mmetsp:Transcript_72456/g.212327  ORF Transcript_72456/g.212327 Transcript_72456/m.212327 type:complete len:305 (+) Transcript_72456:77-991(+)
MLLDCVLREGRGEVHGRARRRCSDCGMGIEEAAFSNMDEALQNAAIESRPPAIELQLSGARRDHTAQFSRMRAAMLHRRAHLAGQDGGRLSARTECPTKDAVALEMARIYEEASQVHTSLASKLAQHNGLKQFGADFAHRAPPLEFRIVLPALEVSIEELLETLRTLSGRLQALDLAAADGGATASQVRNAFADHLQATHEQAQAAFVEQHRHLRELAAASPLFSPTIGPVLGKKLAAAIGSPSLLSTAPTSPDSPVEPLRLAPKELELLDELSEEEEEDTVLSPSTSSRPFEMLLSMGPVGDP